MLFILIESLMLLDLNTYHTDTDADLCIRMMSVCCNLRITKDTLIKINSVEEISPILR